MESFNQNAEQITATLQMYFKGIYEGNVALLKDAFHPQSLVAGDIMGQPYFKTLDQYLQGVQGRKSPQELGERYNMEIISLEIINHTAVAKVRVPIFEYNYIDQLSLVIVGGKWLIVNKLLTHLNN